MKDIEISRVFRQFGFFLFPFLSFAVVLLLFIFGIRPSVVKIFKAREELAKNNARLLVLSDKAKELNLLDEADLRLRVGKLLSVLPADKSVPGLLSGLERMAAEASAAVESFSISPGKISTASGQATSSSEAVSMTEPVMPGSPPYVGFDISLRGNFEALKTFLTSLSSAARTLGVKSVSFSASEIKGRADTVSSIISMRAYYLPYPVTLGVIDEPISKLNSNEEKVYEKAASFTLYSVPPGYGPTGKANPFERF